MDIKYDPSALEPPIQNFMTGKAGPDVINITLLRASSDFTPWLENLILELKNGTHPKNSLEP